MAGDWIKLEHCTPEKPEVFLIADALNIDPDAVVGKLIRVWVWADQQSRDCNVPGVTHSLTDRLAGVAGFGAALVNVGWLVDTGDGLHFTNIDRHITKSAKTRALTRNRVESHRAESNGDVTQGSLQKQDKRVTREEKRREEYKDPPLPPPTGGVPPKGETRKKFKPPSLDEVRSYCHERQNKLDPEQFIDHYTANGWVQARGKPIKDWKAAMRTWERRKADQSYAGRAENTRRLSAVDEVRAAQQRAESERQGPVVAAMERDD